MESKDRFHSWTPIWRAAEKGHEAVVKLLLEKGADVEYKDGNGQTPLLWVRNEAVMKLQLEKGADMKSKDGVSQTLARHRHRRPQGAGTGTRRL